MKRVAGRSAALAVFVGQRNLTQTPGDDSDPGWSPDGRSIVFASNRDGNSEVYVMKADGSEQRRLTRDPAEDAFPVWSPKNP